MKSSFKIWFMGRFFHTACRKGQLAHGLTKKTRAEILKEHKAIIARSKEMSDGRLLSSYLMGAYFIAVNRRSGLDSEQCYEIIADALRNNTMFKKTMGTAEAYLDEKKIPGRMEWARQISSVKNENNWAVEVLPKCSEYDLGYNYTECGICKLCKDEGCPGLAKYMCRLDHIIADMMGADLVRTKTLAEGGDMCDFRYSLKNRA